jgi:hypothetical protein
VPREAEEGFVGLTLDPGFAKNGWAHILFAHPEVAKHTLARIEIRDQIVDGTPQTRIVPESYRVLLEYPVQREVCCHTGGGNDRVLPAKDPSRPTNTSVNNTGLRELPPAQPAMIYYPSGVSEQFPEVGSGGRCAAGGPVYRRADFAADAERPWPAYFEGKWIITDCSRGWIIAVTMDEDASYQSMERLFPGLPFAEPMDMKFGPDGSLYVLDYGSTWFDKSDDSKLVRIEYTAGNRTPVAAASSDRTGGVAPVEIGLSADGSIDHDGDPLRYDIHSDIGGGDVAPCPLGGSWRLGRRRGWCRRLGGRCRLRRRCGRLDVRRARCCFGGSDGRPPLAAALSAVSVAGKGASVHEATPNTAASSSWCATKRQTGLIFAG